MYFLQRCEKEFHTFAENKIIYDAVLKHFNKFPISINPSRISKNALFSINRMIFVISGGNF